jgi:outer membrane immunogenic protein
MPGSPFKRVFAAGLFMAGLVGFAPTVTAQTGFQPTPPYWGGVYVGGYAGYGWGKNSANESGANIYNGAGNSWGHNVEGLLGGARVGYDWESTGLILGIEAGLGYLGVEGDGADPASGGLDTVSILASGPYGELTGRIGFAQEQMLYYMKGGAAFADLDLAVVDSCTAAPCSTSAINAGNDGIETGWVAGLGIGYALTQQLSVNIEYEHIRFDSLTVTGTSGGLPYSWDQDMKINTVTMGAAFRF